MKKINRWLAVTLIVCVLLSIPAFAQGTDDAATLCERPGVELPDCEKPEIELPDCELPDCELPDCELPDYVWPDCELPDVDFDLCDCVVTHIDVKVDSTYFARVDGQYVALHGKLDPDTIKIVVKTPVKDIVYDFADYEVETVEERSMLEYRINLKSPDAFLLAAIRWYGWHMGNVYFNADILLDEVPEVMQESLPQNEDGQYVASVVDHLYTGIQECTGGRGMRSRGNHGIPTGLDLYLTGAALCPYITTDDLTIEKILVDAEGNVVAPGADAPVFTFIMKDADGNYVYFDEEGACTTADAEGASEEIQVKAGKPVTLTGITKGAYQVIELDTEGYKIYSIEGGVSESTGIAVLVGAPDDVITFANKKVETTDPTDPVDPDPKPDPDPDPKPDPKPDPDPDPKPDKPSSDKDTKPDKPSSDKDTKPSKPGDVEIVVPPTDVEPETPAEETPVVAPAPISDDAPKTGDSGSMALMMLMALSALGMGAAVVIGRKFRYTGKRCK